MTLVYLHTSHLSRLAAVMTGDPQRFASFLDTWRSRGYSLAFTRYHLFELRQHADPAVRAARHSVLEHLLPIHTDIYPGTGAFRPPDPLSTREIIAALLLTGEVDVRGDDYEEWVVAYATGLPCRIDDSRGVDALRAFEDPRSESIARIMKSAFESEAEARRPGFEAGGSGPRELPAAPVRAGYGGFSGPEGDPARVRGPIDVLSRNALWDHQVREVLRDVLWVGAEGAALAGLVTLEDCPGTWLARSVALEIRRDDSDPGPGDGYDLEHLGHLPYVHRFFTDERIAGHVRRVLDRKGVPEPFRGMRRAEAIPDSIDDLERALAE